MQPHKTAYFGQNVVYSLVLHPWFLLLWCGHDLSCRCRLGSLSTQQRRRDIFRLPANSQCCCQETANQLWTLSRDRCISRQRDCESLQLNHTQGHSGTETTWPTSFNRGPENILLLRARLAFFILPRKDKICPPISIRGRKILLIKDQSLIKHAALFAFPHGYWVDRAERWCVYSRFHFVLFRINKLSKFKQSNWLLVSW